MNNILIVEDEHLIARLIEMTLTRAGYRCTLAEDGRTAADLIETTNFDMALLDIMLPGLVRCFHQITSALLTESRTRLVLMTTIRAKCNLHNPISSFLNY